MTTHVLYLSYDGMTDPLGYSQVISYLKKIAEQQVRFTLISFEKPARWQQHGETLHQELAAYPIRWIPLVYHKSPPILSTLYDLWRLRQLAKRVQQEDAADIVHCRGYLTAIIGHWLQKKAGVRFLFDMRAFFADERRESGQWRANHPLYSRVYGYFKRKEKEFLSDADAVVSLTHKGKSVLETWGTHAPIHVIPCAADLNHFSPNHVSEVQRNNLKTKLSISDQFVLTYVGSLGRYLPEAMMLFFRQLRLQQPSAVFLLLTQESPRIIVELAARHGIPQSALRIQSVERSEMPTYLSLANWGIFFASTGLGKTLYSPVKMGELLAMGIPLICNQGLGDADTFIETFQVGYTLTDFSPESMQVTVRHMLQNPPNPENMLKAAKTIFQLEEGAAKYKAIYTQLKG